MLEPPFLVVVDGGKWWQMAGEQVSDSARKSNLSLFTENDPD